MIKDRQPHPGDPSTWDNAAMVNPQKDWNFSYPVNPCGDDSADCAQCTLHGDECAHYTEFVRETHAERARTQMHPGDCTQDDPRTLKTHGAQMHDV